MGVITPGPSASGKWRTVLDLDFSAASSLPIATDTTYSIGGFTWTKINSANDAVAMGITNGSGLIVTPVQTTDLYTTTRTLPAITTPFSGLSSNITTTTPLRFWAYVKSINNTTNYDDAIVAIYQESVSNKQAFVAIKRGQNGGDNTYFEVDCNGARKDYGTLTLTSNVWMIELPCGLLGQRATIYNGTYSSGFPALSAMVSQQSILAYTDDTMLTTSQLGGLGDWLLMLGAIRNGGHSGFAVTFGAVRVDCLV